MSKERRDISQRKIRRIKRTLEESEVEQQIQTSKIQKILTPNTKLYYTKVIFGIITGGISGFIFVFLNISPELWFVFLIIGLITCVMFVKMVLKIPEKDLDQKRLWFSGTFTYILLFIVISSLIWMMPGPRF
ncbi:MAG: hypothetical protein ACTSW1_12440 [Candidatus Hodarchaeales archaeon]